MIFRRKRATGPDIDALLVPGELVRVQAYAGARADEEPRAIVVAGDELAVEAVEWRALIEEGGTRRRTFVVRVRGRRVRLAVDEETGRWIIERVWPPRPTDPA